MQKDQFFARYLEGNWHEFSQLLEQMITLRVEEGDHVQLSRLFSYYGIANQAMPCSSIKITWRSELWLMLRQI